MPGAPVEALADRVELLDLAAVLSTPPEAIDWMWGEGERGYIEAGTLTLLNAAGGAGKSMLAIALARAVQRGEALLGQPTRRGNVAYLDGEIALRMIARRLHHHCLMIRSQTSRRT